MDREIDDFIIKESPSKARRTKSQKYRSIKFAHKSFEKFKEMSNRPIIAYYERAEEKLRKRVNNAYDQMIEADIRRTQDDATIEDKKDYERCVDELTKLGVQLVNLEAMLERRLEIEKDKKPKAIKIKSSYLKNVKSRVSNIASKIKSKIDSRFSKDEKGDTTKVLVETLEKIDNDEKGKTPVEKSTTISNIMGQLTKTKPVKEEVKVEPIVEQKTEQDNPFKNSNEAFDNFMNILSKPVPGIEPSVSDEKPVEPTAYPKDSDEAFNNLMNILSKPVPEVEQTISEKADTAIETTEDSKAKEELGPVSKALLDKNAISDVDVLNHIEDCVRISNAIEELVNVKGRITDTKVLGAINDRLAELDKELSDTMKVYMETKISSFNPELKEPVSEKTNDEVSVEPSKKTDEKAELLTQFVSDIKEYQTEAENIEVVEPIVADEVTSVNNEDILSSNIEETVVEPIVQEPVVQNVKTDYEALSELLDEGFTKDEILEAAKDKTEGKDFSYQMGLIEGRKIAAETETPKISR